MRRRGRSRAHVDDADRFGAVVAAEEDQCVVGHAKFIECGQEFPDNVIQLMDKIAVGPGLGRTLEPTRGK